MTIDRTPLSIFLLTGCLAASTSSSRNIGGPARPHRWLEVQLCLRRQTAVAIGQSLPPRPNGRDAHRSEDGKPVIFHRFLTDPASKPTGLRRGG